MELWKIADEEALHSSAEWDSVALGGRFQHVMFFICHDPAVLPLNWKNMPAQPSFAGVPPPQISSPFQVRLTKLLFKLRIEPDRALVQGTGLEEAASGWCLFCQTIRTSL